MTQKIALRNHICKICGKHFKSPNHKLYCSEECFNKRPCSVSPIICPSCHKPFTPRIKGNRRQTFCSRKCRWEFERNNTKNITIICERCHKPFVVYPSRITWGNPRYCSGECAGNIPIIQNERFRRIKTPQWVEIRRNIIKRDGYHCAVCNSKTTHRSSYYSLGYIKRRQ
jgi:hypothetical protein